MRWRTLRAVSRLVNQMGSSTSMTSVPAMASTGMSPSRGSA